MDMKEYLDRCTKCRQHLGRIVEHKTVNVGPFIAALKYVLENKFNRPCMVYNAQCGILDFSVGVIRFKLLWQPESPHLALICRHMEGEKFIDTGMNESAADLITELIDTVGFSVSHVTPFDV